jgi:hypothetical protein
MGKKEYHRKQRRFVETRTAKGSKEGWRKQGKADETKSKVRIWKNYIEN